jgi:hypothetical protein
MLREEQNLLVLTGVLLDDPAKPGIGEMRI